MSNETKERLALRMQPETKRKIDQWYKTAGCRSRNEFLEKAVNFYADYLAVNDNNALLPTAILSAINGRLDMLEDRLSSLSFKHSVELDMVTGIIADSYEFDEDDLRRRRAESVRNVKQTNGRLAFEKKVRQRDDDAWQD